MQNTFIGSNSESTPLIGSRQENGTFPEAQVHPKEEPELPTKDYEVSIDITPLKLLTMGFNEEAIRCTDGCIIDIIALRYKVVLYVWKHGLGLETWPRCLERSMGPFPDL